MAGLREYLRDQNDWGGTRRSGPSGASGRPPKELVPDLIGIARDEPATWLRFGVAQRPGRDRPGQPGGRSLLREWIADNDPDLRPAAEAALKKLTAKPDPK